MIRLILEKRKDNEQYLRLRYDLKASNISGENFLNSVNSTLSKESIIVGSFESTISIIDRRSYYGRFEEISRVYKHKSGIYVTTGILIFGKNEYGGLEFLSDNGTDVAKKSDDILDGVRHDNPNIQFKHFKRGHWICS